DRQKREGDGIWAFYRRYRNAHRVTTDGTCVDKTSVDKTSVASTSVDKTFVDQIVMDKQQGELMRRRRIK
ncbi:MAG: hypothetical protein ACRC8Q_02280, partial [Aeromonas sp.]